MRNSEPDGRIRGVRAAETDGRRSPEPRLRSVSTSQRGGVAKLSGMKPGTTHARSAHPATHAAQQVAYAWQVAARDLRFTHPELHAQLSETRAQAARRRGARRPRARDPAPAGARNRGDRSRPMPRAANSRNCARRSPTRCPASTPRSRRGSRAPAHAHADRRRFARQRPAAARAARDVEPAELAPTRETLRESPKAAAR